MKMQIKGILFDFDGTIANTIDLIIATFEHTCREVLGFTPEREKIVATFGLPTNSKKSKTHPNVSYSSPIPSSSSNFCIIHP